MIVDVLLHLGALTCIPGTGCEHMCTSKQHAGRKSVVVLACVAMTGFEPRLSLKRCLDGCVVWVPCVCGHKACRSCAGLQPFMRFVTVSVRKLCGCGCFDCRGAECIHVWATAQRDVAVRGGDKHVTRDSCFVASQVCGRRGALWRHQRQRVAPQSAIRTTGPVRHQGGCKLGLWLELG
jgi:hypothetical protein